MHGNRLNGILRAVRRMRGLAFRRRLKSAGDELAEAARRMYGPSNVLAVRKYDSAVIAKVRVAGVEERLVLKRLPNRNCAYSASRFALVHKRACRHGGAIRELFPPVRAADDQEQVVVLAFQHGVCQYASLRRALAGWQKGRSGDTRLRRELDATARGMAQVHGLSPAAVRISGTGRCSWSWLQNTLSYIKRLPLRRLNRPHEISAILEACLGNWRRSDTTLLLGDAQPGNVIIRPDGSTHFIDLGFRAGRPAHEVASYLVGIDTIGLRYPLSRRKRLITAWKESFTRSYVEANRSCRRGEIICFYLRALARHWDRHRHRIPWLRWYIDEYYRELIEDALRQAETLANRPDMLGRRDARDETRAE